MFKFESNDDDKERLWGEPVQWWPKGNSTSPMNLKAKPGHLEFRMIICGDDEHFALNLG